MHSQSRLLGGYKLFPLCKLAGLHHTGHFALPVHFALNALPVVEEMRGNRSDAQLVEHSRALRAIVVVEFHELGVQGLYQCALIDGLIDAEVPMVGKVVARFYARHRKLPYIDAEYSGYVTYGLVHIIHGEVFTADAEEVFGAARDYNFAEVL